MTWTLQIAHVSHSTSQLHIATAFHFFKVNILSDFWDSGSPRSTPSLASANFVVSTHHTVPYNVAKTNVVATAGGKHKFIWIVISSVAGFHWLNGHIIFQYNLSAGYGWKGTIEIMSQYSKLEPKTESNKNSSKQVSRIFNKVPGNVHYSHFLSREKTLVLLLRQ
jgi:hypothetical protein